MDDDSNTTFEERMNEIWRRRENDGDIPGELSEVTGRPDPAPTFGSALVPGTCQYEGCAEPAQPRNEYCRNQSHTSPGGLDISTRPDPTPLTGRDPQDAVFGGASADEIDLEELRRDISRLEGKIDALLTALEVKDGDE